MTWLDYAVLGVMGISILWGVWRGLVREVISLAGWVIAFLAANLFAGPMGEVMPSAIPGPELRLVAAFVAIFIGSLILTSLVGRILSGLARAAGLGGLDRALGGMFGIARGLIVAVAFALVAGLTELPLRPVWKGSVSGAWLAQAALAFKPWLPPAFAARLRYH